MGPAILHTPEMSFASNALNGELLRSQSEQAVRSDGVRAEELRPIIQTTHPRHWRVLMRSAEPCHNSAPPSRGDRSADMAPRCVTPEHCMPWAVS
jgi:hypothetical protein